MELIHGIFSAEKKLRRSEIVSGLFLVKFIKLRRSEIVMWSKSSCRRNIHGREINQTSQIGVFHGIQRNIFPTIPYIPL